MPAEIPDRNFQMCVCVLRMPIANLAYVYKSTASIRVNHFDENQNQSAQDFPVEKHRLLTTWKTLWAILVSLCSHYRRRHTPDRDFV